MEFGMTTDNHPLMDMHEMKWGGLQKKPEEDVEVEQLTRNCVDFQIISHFPFACVFVLSIYKRFYEMTMLLGLVLVFSLTYHFGWEKRTVYSYVDNCTAFTLSMYGNVQLFFSPSPLILGINISLGVSSAVIFVLGYTNFFSRYYGCMHPVGLHIIPAIWSGIVVLFQQPLLF